jgi:hypothetical protein
MLRAVLGKAMCGELPTTIGAESPDLPAGLSLGSCLERCERTECFILHGQQHDPHEQAHVVDQKKEVAFAS